MTSIKKSSKKRKTTKLKEFTVNRKRWDRGANAHGALLNEESTMCCLGFLARSCDLKAADIRDRSDFSSFSNRYHVETNERLVSRVPGLYVKSGLRTKQIHDDIVEVNDAGELNDTQREVKLARLFKRAGIRVRFVG